MSREFIKDHRELEIYKMAFQASMTIFELSKKFPSEEKYSLTDPSGSQSLMGETPKTALSHQMRRSSRSVCAKGAEAWRKRRYEAAFIAKLSDCEAALKDTASHKAAETQTWIEFAVKCDYMNVEVGREIYGTYNRVLSGLVSMINHPSPWLMKSARKKETRKEKGLERIK